MTAPQRSGLLRHALSLLNLCYHGATVERLAMIRINLASQRFAHLVAVRPSDKKSKVGTLWVCRCDCGNLTEVDSLKLRSGHTKSCGCLKERTLAAGTNKSHGMSKNSRTYKTWKEMRQRCNNPNNDKWQWYGGRGIKVCERWASFENFLADMGERPENKTLDRIDNNADYEPGNCRWITQLEQTRRQEKNKLRDGVSEALKKDRLLGMSYRALGKKYGISATTAHRCCMGQTWFNASEHQL